MNKDLAWEVLYLHGWVTCANWPLRGKPDDENATDAITCLLCECFPPCCRCMQVSPSPGRGTDSPIYSWRIPTCWSNWVLPPVLVSKWELRTLSRVHHAEALSTSVRPGVSPLVHDLRRSWCSPFLFFLFFIEVSSPWLANTIDNPIAPA